MSASWCGTMMLQTRSTKNMTSGWLSLPPLICLNAVAVWGTLENVHTAADGKYCRFLSMFLEKDGRVLVVVQANINKNRKKRWQKHHNFCFDIILQVSVKRILFMASSLFQWHVIPFFLLCIVQQGEILHVGYLVHKSRESKFCWYLSGWCAVCEHGRVHYGVPSGTGEESAHPRVSRVENSIHQRGYPSCDTTTTPPARGASQWEGNQARQGFLICLLSTVSLHISAQSLRLYFLLAFVFTRQAYVPLWRARESYCELSKATIPANSAGTNHFINLHICPTGPFEE